MSENKVTCLSKVALGIKQRGVAVDQGRVQDKI